MPAALSQQEALHLPVLLRETVSALAPADGGLYLDATFGNGGYSEAILNAAACSVIAIDRDPDAIARGAAMLKVVVLGLAAANRVRCLAGNRSFLLRSDDFVFNGLRVSALVL